MVKAVINVKGSEVLGAVGAPVDGVFCPKLPLLTLEVVADAVGVREELCVGVKRDGVHVTGARFDIAALWTLRETPSRPVTSCF